MSKIARPKQWCVHFHRHRRDLGWAARNAPPLPPEIAMPVQPPQPIRVLFVEWHPVLSNEARSALSRDPAFQIVGDVTSAVEATQLVRGQPPDVVVCESTLPDPGAVELARFFRMRLPETVIVFVTPSTSQDELFEAARVGVAAYLRGSMDDRLFVQVVRRAARGEFPIDDEVVRHPAVASRIMAQFRMNAVGDPAHDGGTSNAPPAPADEAGGLAPLFVPLSAREIEIIDLVARGNSNKLIARQLGISDQTVKNHVSAILRKLEVNDRTEAVVYALRNGWIRMDSPMKASR